MEISDIKRKLPGVLLALSFSVLTACGSNSPGDSSNNENGSGDGDGDNVETTKACAGGTTCGQLDPLQVIVADVVGGQLASALPAPLGPVVGCASDAIINVVDVPDALIVGLGALATEQNPEALVDAFGDIGTSLGNAVFNLQGLLTTLAGSESTCSESGNGDADDGGSGDTPPPAGPTGTPLDLALAPLVDGLDTLLVALQDGAEGTPAAAAVDPIVDGLNALLAVLKGGDSGGGDNPLTDVLAQLQEQLAGLAGGGDGGDGGDTGSEDLDLIPLTDVLSTVTDAISKAIGQGRTLLTSTAGSEVPVIGGLLLTLETTLADAGTLLNAVGSYDGIATNAAVESLAENLLGNVLTQVIPLELIGNETGQDFAGPIRDGIGQGVSALGDVTVLLIDPLLSGILDDAASPLLDPIEGVIAQLLAASPVDLGDTLSGGLDQLVSALTDLSGDGGGDGANPLDALLGGLAALGGDEPAGDGPTGTPLDLLLGALVDNDPSGQLGGLLGQISDGLLGLFAQLQALAP
jgi:hypothetical protein